MVLFCIKYWHNVCWLCLSYCCKKKKKHDIIIHSFCDQTFVEIISFRVERFPASIGKVSIWSVTISFTDLFSRVSLFFIKSPKSCVYTSCNISFKIKVLVLRSHISRIHALTLVFMSHILCFTLFTLSNTNDRLVPAQVVSLLSPTLSTAFLGVITLYTTKYTTSIMIWQHYRKKSQVNIYPPLLSWNNLYKIGLITQSKLP